MPQNPHNILEGQRPDLVLDLSGDKRDELVSIIITHYERPEYVNICLQSIAACSVNNNIEIVIVDNNSGKRTQDFLDSLDDKSIKIIKNDKNLYWTKSANLGAKAADKDSSYFIFMDADTVVLKHDWLDLLINVSESSSAGVVGTKMSHYSMDNQKIDYVEGWCCLITKPCWETVGGFNEALPQIGSTFLFTLSAQAKGFNPRCISTPIVHHYHVSSLDISLYEKFAEQAAIEIPTQMRKMPELSSLVKTS